MLDPSRIPFTPVSFISSITYSVYAFWSSRPCIGDPEAHSLALRWTVSFVESFTGALAKSSDTTGPSPLLRLQELPLSVAPYSITLSALADGLWSLICSSSIIYIYIYFSRNETFIDWFLEQPFIKCLNTWPKRIGPVSGRGCHFVFYASFILYIYLTSFLISPIPSLLIFRES